MIAKEKKNSYRCICGILSINKGGLRATLNFRKFKVALIPTYINFLNFANSCVLSCLSKVGKIVYVCVYVCMYVCMYVYVIIQFYLTVFELSAPKAVIKSVF